MKTALPGYIGRYVIVDRLGQGGMGVVYRGWDPHLQRAIAIKMLAPGDDAPHRHDLMERFAREARSAAALAHRNIVTIYDVGQDAGRPFIAMEYLEGESLAALIDRGAPASMGEKIQLAIELCDGLAYAHDRGVVHRDVKPSNLMVTPEGVLKILDFGLARVVGDFAQVGLTQTGAVLGTLQYMSPEQMLGRAADARSDVFAVGAVLYELFTGRRAFAATSLALAVREIAEVTPPAIRELAPDLPAELESAVAKAMEKDPARRTQSADDLARVLRRVSRQLGSERDVRRMFVSTDSRSHEADVSQTPSSSSGHSASDGLDNVLENWGEMVGELLAGPTPAGESHAEHALGSSEATGSEVRSTVPAARATKTTAVVPAGGIHARVTEILAVAIAIGAVILYFYFARGTDQEPAPPVRAPSSTEVPVSDPPLPSAPTPGRSTSPAPAQGSPAGSSAAAGRTAPPRGAAPSARCAALLERVSLGEELSAVDHQLLIQQCRNGGR